MTPPSSLLPLPSSLRSHFPALERVHAGHPVAYFDGPGGTQVPRAVVEAMADYLYHHNANTHWEYPSSAETDRLIEGARQALADFLGADAGEIAFGANMTTITLHVARALVRGWEPGDEIVVTELDHRANVDPWLEAARDRGLVVRMARVDTATGTLDWEHLRSKLSSRTRLVAVGAASNALGTVTDVAAVAELARSAGALSYVDAVHYAPHHLVDVRAIGCDFLACSAYKFYGPHVGVLYGRRALLESLDVPKLAPAPDEAPERLETGTQSHEGMVGAAAAVDFLAGLGEGEDRRAALAGAYAALHAHGQALVTRLWEGLAATDGVTLYGPPPDRPRTPTVSFVVRGLGADEVTRRLAARGVWVSHGDFYASTVVARLGHADDGGLVRAGCACYTTEEEVERLVAGVREIVAAR
ncbi:MAG TPA: cysteine desulfurase-like protein [Gemmatimonadaceae bacterium]|nr:cysteine desulfurase-like protein [Gemmatimonadaceae bacterium]